MTHTTKLDSDREANGVRQPGPTPHCRLCGQKILLAADLDGVFNQVVMRAPGKRLPLADLAEALARILGWVIPMPLPGQVASESKQALTKRAGTYVRRLGLGSDLRSVRTTASRASSPITCLVGWELRSAVRQGGPRKGETKNGSSKETHPAEARTPFASSDAQHVPASAP